MRVETREIRGIISLSNTGRDCYVKYHQAGPGSIFKADDAEETSGQDHHPGHYRDCGVGRMAFYYHFKDIYDLVEWSCVEDASRALQGKKTYDTWHEGLLQIFEADAGKQAFILNAYRCISRDQMEELPVQADLRSDSEAWWMSRARAWRSLRRIRPSSRNFINTALWESCWTGSSRG